MGGTRITWHPGRLSCTFDSMVEPSDRGIRGFTRMSIRITLTLMLGVAGLVGCDGGEPEPGADSGVMPADGGPNGDEPGSPAAAAGPSLTPCPDGWTARFVVDGSPECVPWDAAESCLTQFQVPGRGCVPFGVECPADGWPADVPGDALFVDPTAPAGGTGTREAPLSLIEEALAIAPPGAVVALRAGEHRLAEAALTAPIELRGACASATRLVGTAPGFSAVDAVISVTAPEVIVRQLTVIADQRAAVFVGAGGELTAEALQIPYARGFGVGVLDGRLEATDLYVDGVSRGVTGAGGRGLDVEGTGSAVVRGARFGDAAEVSVYVTGTARIEDAALVGTVNPDTPDFPFFDRESGASVESGGELTLVRTLVERHSGRGLYASGDAALTLEDVVVRDNLEEGLVALRSAQLTLRRVLFEPGHGWSLRLDGSAVTLDAEDLISRGPLLRHMSVTRGAQATLRRAAFLDAGDIGVMVEGEGGAFIASDLLIQGTRGDFAPGATGRGLNVQNGAHVELERARFAGNRGAALYLSGDAPAPLSILTDVSIDGTRSELGDGTLGSGFIVAGEGREVNAERLAVTGSRGVGVWVAGGAAATLHDLVVRDTRQQACASVSCMDAAGGTGLGAYGGATVAVERFLVEDAVLCGVQVATGANLSLSHGRVVGNRIGACVQVVDYPLEQLETSTVYLDNEVNLDSVSLPVPAAPPPLNAPIVGAESP